MKDWLDEQPFYEACQQYRHAQEYTQPTVFEAFEALKEFIRDKIEDEVSEAVERAEFHYSRYPND